MRFSSLFSEFATWLSALFVSFRTRPTQLPLWPTCIGVWIWLPCELQRPGQHRSAG